VRSPKVASVRALLFMNDWPRSQSWVTIECMFEGWERFAEYPTLYRVERDVIVDVARLFPASGIRRDELPLWVKSCGLRLEPSMPARQLAWIRRADGGWLAIVVMPASSANGRSTLTIQLWLSPDGLTTDLTI
jgi:hypothetical protein